MKLLVTVNKKEHLDKFMHLNVDGIIVGIDGLSVNTNFSCLKEDILPLLNQNKEVYLLLNKMIHNKDLAYLEEVMTYFKDKPVKFIFYDLAVIKIAQKLQILNKLIIKQDHLNNSIMSNNFYASLNIGGAILSSDLTLEEILEIKEKASYQIYITSYGYIPIFHSKRLLITSYLDYLHQDKQTGYYFLKDHEKLYPINEDQGTTTVYNYQKIDYLDEYPCFFKHHLDYLILDSLNDEDNFEEVIKQYNQARFDGEIPEAERYKGFLYTKTIYRVKKNDK